jgi:hypothetical protein
LGIKGILYGRGLPYCLYFFFITFGVVKLKKIKITRPGFLRLKLCNALDTNIECQRTFIFFLETCQTIGLCGIRDPCNAEEPFWFVQFW